MRFYLFFLFVGLCFIKSAYAAEWAIDGRIKQNFSYDDNVRMLEEKQGSFIYEITPVLNASYRTLNSEIAASASYGYQLYEAIPDFNRGTQNYTLLGSYLTERTTYSLSASYSKAPARNSADIDTGNNTTNADRASWSVAPVIAYRISAIDTLSIKGSYGETLYSSDQFVSDIGGFSDNKNALLDLGWTRQWSERFSGGVSVTYYHYESEPTLLQLSNSIVSDSYGINFSNSYLLSEKWKIIINLGYRYTDTKNNVNIIDQSIDQTSHGFTTDSSLTYNGEVISASASISQSLVPSGQGQLNQQSGVNLTFGYKLTQRLSAGLQTSYLYSKPIGGVREILGEERQNITVTPSINYQLAPDWTLSGSYRYRLQDNSQLGNVTDSNTIMLTLGYNWPGLSLSR